MERQQVHRTEKSSDFQDDPFPQHEKYHDYRGCLFNEITVKIIDSAPVFFASCISYNVSRGLCTVTVTDPNFNEVVLGVRKEPDLSSDETCHVLDVLRCV